MTYAYDPIDLIFIVRKDVKRSYGNAVEMMYVVEHELTPGKEGDNRYLGLEFSANDLKVTLKPYRGEINFDLENYLKRIGL